MSVSSDVFRIQLKNKKYSIYINRKFGNQSGRERPLALTSDNPKKLCLLEQPVVTLLSKQFAYLSGFKVFIEDLLPSKYSPDLPLMPAFLSEVCY